MEAGYGRALVAESCEDVSFPLYTLNLVLTHVRFKKNPTPFWDSVKPSALGASRPQWMTFDDEWVDEVARGLKACKVFLWYPLYCTFITP